VAKGLDDASQDVRKSSKAALQQLDRGLSKDELENVLVNSLGKQDYARVKEYFEKEMNIHMTA
jgi:hypothetical protein